MAVHRVFIHANAILSFVTRGLGHEEEHALEERDESYGPRPAAATRLRGIQRGQTTQPRDRVGDKGPWFRVCGLGFVV